MRLSAARNAALVLLAAAALTACQQDDTVQIPEDGGIRTDDPGLGGASPSIENENGGQEEG